MIQQASDTESVHPFSKKRTLFAERICESIVREMKYEITRYTAGQIDITQLAAELALHQKCLEAVMKSRQIRSELAKMETKMLEEISDKITPHSKN